MNVSDVITNALGMLGVLREGEAPSAEQGNDGLTVFNDLVASMREHGIDLPIPSQSSTTTTLQVNEGDRLTLKAMMAVYLSPYYPGRQLNPMVSALAKAGWDRWLRNAVISENQPIQMRSISKGTSNTRTSNSINIINGS